MTRKMNWDNAAAKEANPFDAIAAGVKPTKSKSTKLAAVVTDEVKVAVDTYVAKKAALKQVEMEMEQAGEIIITSVREQQDRNARSGNFSKSYEVAGNTSRLTYTTSDKFSTPKEPEAQKQLKELLKDRFDQLFRIKRTISLKEKMQEDVKVLQRVVKALTDAGIDIADTFDVVDVLVAKDDLDRNQYELTPKELGIFRTLVKQNKPSLR